MACRFAVLHYDDDGWKRRRLTMTSLLMTLALSLAPTPEPNKGGTEKRPDNLHGEWVLVETADEKCPDRGHHSIRMVIKGNKVTMTFFGMTTNEGTIELGPGRGDLGIIDMKLGDGKLAAGAYRLDGNMLTICFDEAGKERPSNLTPKGTQWSEKWRRLRS
jgi:uncharacterized protein (TIGR03067 family)